MNAPDQIVFLLDCDNTLLDNDPVIGDLINYPLPGTPRAACVGHTGEKQT